MITLTRVKVGGNSFCHTMWKEYATQGSTEEGYISPLFLQREKDAYRKSCFTTIIRQILITALNAKCLNNSWFCFSLLISSIQSSQLEKITRDVKQNEVSSLFILIPLFSWKQQIQAGCLSKSVLTEEMTSTIRRLYAD